MKQASSMFIDDPNAGDLTPSEREVILDKWKVARSSKRELPDPCSCAREEGDAELHAEQCPAKIASTCRQIREDLEKR